MQVFHECYGLETVVLRFFNVFGQRQNPESAYAAVIPMFCRALLRGERPYIEGDGLQSRDFTYVKDCVAGTIRAMLAPQAPGRVFNIACGRSTTVLELYEIVAGLLGSDIQPEFRAPRIGDLPHSLADITESRSVLGYEPQYTVAQGLAEAVRWYVEYYRDKAGSAA
jgi:nucleoside-diphosphate-sugar epimerase